MTTNRWILVMTVVAATMLAAVPLVAVTTSLRSELVEGPVVSVNVGSSVMLVDNVLASTSGGERRIAVTMRPGQMITGPDGPVNLKTLTLGTWLRARVKKAGAHDAVWVRETDRG